MAQGGMICLVLIIVKLYPDLLNIDIAWFIAGLVLLYIRPLYVFYLQKSCN